MKGNGGGSRKEWWRRTGTRNWQASTCVNDTRPLRPSSLVALCRHSINTKARPSPILLPVFRHRAPVEPAEDHHGDEFSLSYDLIFLHSPNISYLIICRMCHCGEGWWGNRILSRVELFGFSFRRASIYPYGTEL